jgi:hypothetical protein
MLILKRSLSEFNVEYTFTEIKLETFNEIKLETSKIITFKKFKNSYKFKDTFLTEPWLIKDCKEN